MDKARQTINAAANTGKEGATKVNGALEKAGEEVSKAFQDPTKAAEKAADKVNGAVKVAAEAVGANGAGALEGKNGDAEKKQGKKEAVPPVSQSQAKVTGVYGSSSSSAGASGHDISQAEYHSGEQRRITSPGRTQHVLPPSSSFHPSLPADIPKPPASGTSASMSSQAPAELGQGAGSKRKSADDFTPTGSRSESFTSPNKQAVKFEDGVSPGEGREGEKTMPRKKAEAVAADAGKKKGDVFQRTVWTFIMVAGFISQLLPSLRYEADIPQHCSVSDTRT